MRITVVGNSLSDQLLKAGLVDEKKAKRNYKQKRQQEKLRRKGQAVAEDESKQRVQQQQAEQAARDRELNLQHKAAAEQRAIEAQIEQLIERNRQRAETADLPYNFTDGTRVKRLYVDELMEDWVAFLGKIDFPYTSNCMRTVVGSQKITCVDFADSMSRYTSDETWDDLIEAAGAEEELQELFERWQGMVMRWEHMNASFRESMSYWPGKTG